MRRGAPVTAEALAAGILGAGAAVMVAGILLDAAHLSIRPTLSVVVAIACGAALAAITAHASTGEEAVHGVDLALFALVSVAISVWLVRVAWPSLLPIADGPDIVHHLSLIHVIQRARGLPHDAALAPYLGEMMQYTPGSHLLAAALASVVRVDALRVVHPVMAVSAGLKAGLVFLVARRVLPADRASAWRALAAPILLLVPAEYFIRSIVGFGFYAQVVSEMFAAGMLLAIVAWNVTRARAWLIVFAVAGVGSLLSWPVWVPVAIATFAIVIVARRGVRAGVRDMCIAFVPVVVVGMWHVATHRGGASILGSSGVATVPTVAAFGAGFVVLTLAGVFVAVRDDRARPVLVFLAVAALHAAALAAFNRATGSSSLYLPYKMVYLMVLPSAALGACALARASAFIPARGAAFTFLSAALPVAVAIALVWGRIPTSRPRSPINEDAYAAGLWARDRLPAGCIDYFSRHWLTGYWLHLDVLWNPRASARMREETFEFKDVAAKWIEGRGMPFAIVEDVASLPNELRPDVDVVARFGPTAVIHRRTPTRAVCSP